MEATQTSSFEVYMPSCILGAIQIQFISGKETVLSFELMIWAYCLCRIVPCFECSITKSVEVVWPLPSRDHFDWRKVTARTDLTDREKHFQNICKPSYSLRLKHYTATGPEEFQHCHDSPLWFSSSETTEHLEQYYRLLQSQRNFQLILTEKKYSRIKNYSRSPKAYSSIVSLCLQS